MIKKKIFAILLLVFVIISLSGSSVKPVFAKPLSAQRLYYAGGFIPDEGVNISLLKADVLINANTSDFNSLWEMTFNGNYTIFNHDETANITIAAPFRFFPTNNCTITVNGSITHYLLYFRWEDDAEPWNQYLVNRTEIPLDYDFWLVCNISIPENHFLHISYAFSTLSVTYHLPTWGNYYLIYDVGTSQLWNGNITEEVNINVHGNLPDTIYYEEKCNVQNLNDGKSYTWNWDDERIKTNFVGVSFYFNNIPNIPPYLAPLLNLMTILACLIGLSILIYHKNSLSLFFSYQKKRRELKLGKVFGIVALIFGSICLLINAALIAFIINDYNRTYAIIFNYEIVGPINAIAWIIPVIAIIFGRIGINDEDSKGLAITGLILGIIGLLVGVYITFATSVY